jgi:chemotaxis family two-component system response regulator Rcp1
VNPASARPVHILLVEDSEPDVELTIEALRDAKVLNELHVVRDGVEAMAYLHRQGPYAKAARPDLVLLDLNMPRKSGREVLTEMKADPKLAMIPVVVLTTSAADVDVLRSYELSAAAYITKPVDFDQFVSVIHTLKDFWLAVVRLPPRTSGD